MISEFFQPDTLVKALQLRRDCEGSSLLAGGTDFVVAMRNDEGPEGSIIDLSKVAELKGIEEVGDSIRIGSMTSFTEIADSSLLRDTANILCDAAKTIGSPQIRNRATIGGNICNASAAADSLTSLLCLDADVKIQSLAPDGTVYAWILPLEDFLIDSKKTTLKSNEILTDILFKRPLAELCASFQKIGRRNALAIARINGSCIFRLNENWVENIRFALGAATSKPERIKEVEAFLMGRELTPEVLDDAGKKAADYVLKQTGIRSSSEYKLPVIEKFTVSMINAALGKEE